MDGDHRKAEEDLGSFYSFMLKVDFPAAGKSIEEAVRLWPENSRYYTWRAYWKSQNLPPQCLRIGSALDSAGASAASDAAADYRKALELNPRDAVAHHNLAWLEHLRGNDASARAEWERAAAIDPDNAIFHISLGVFLEENSDAAGAANEYAKAVQISPSTLDSPFFARYRARSPQAADALVVRCIREMEAAGQDQSDPILNAHLGKLYLYHQETGRAAAALELAAERLPNLPLVWLNLGDVFLAQGNTEAAMNCYEKSRTLNGGLPAPWLRLAQIWQSRGVKEEEKKSFEATVQRWGHRRAVTASQNNRLYLGRVLQQIDDLLPTTLVWYATPCEASAAYRALAELSPENRFYRLRINTCEEIPAPHKGF
jgi:tetratricopeptide (TPR) repeat protein